LIEEFMKKYSAFSADLGKLSTERQLITNLRPIALPRFPAILQIRSNLSSTKYSLELIYILWDKPAATFQSSTFNGVKMPNIPVGTTFATKKPPVFLNFSTTRAAQGGRNSTTVDGQSKTYQIEAVRGSKDENLLAASVRNIELKYVL
jgi:hypothetical protein